MDADVPVAVRHNVMAGAGLRLGGCRQLVLLALRGDEIDPHLDIVLCSPFIAERGEGIVGAGYPMIPNAKRKTSGRIAAFYVWRGNCRDRTEYRRFEKAAARGPRLREGRMGHGVSSYPVPYFLLVIFYLAKTYSRRRNPARGPIPKFASVSLCELGSVGRAVAGSLRLLRWPAAAQRHLHDRFSSRAGSAPDP